MANKHSPSKLNELSSESEVSDLGSDSDWDDSEVDPDYEETHTKLSNLSLGNKTKARVGEGAETDPEVLEITTPDLDDANFEKIIKVGLLEKLKVEECKIYLRKNGLRLTGNKDVLIQRIREHQEIINGVGEKKYPPSSFVLNCKGDACTGDVVLFEQNVYEMFNIASRSASGPPCGKRIVAGRIVKESYGAAKQQHTFTIEVLWSKGEKPFSPLHPLLIKGRNLYRLKTLRQKWEDEGKRQKILVEKHSRGSVARADREVRIQTKTKEKRKTTMKNRVTDKDSVRHQHQSHSSRPTPQCQPQETDTSTNPEKPAFQSRNSAPSAIGTGREMSRAIANTSAAATEQRGIPFGSKTVSVGSDQLGKKPIDSGKTSLNVRRLHDQQQAWKRSAYYGSTNFDVDPIRKAELSANYNFPDFHYGEKQTAIGRHGHHPLGEYPLIEDYIHYQQAWKRLADCGSTFNNDHAFNAERNRLTERTHHVLGSMNNGENYKKRQTCRYYARGSCYFGDVCKFSHDFE